MPHASGITSASLSRLVAVLIILVALAAIVQSSSPDQTARARRLDELFAALKATKDMEEGDAIVTDIWTIWMQSGSVERDSTMQEVTKLMAYGQYGTALAQLDRIVADAPNWAEGWNKRATLLYMMGEHDRSLADIGRVLALEPRHFGALAGTGLILMDKGKPREALAVFRRAKAINPFLKESYGIMPRLEKEIGEEPQ